MSVAGPSSRRLLSRIASSRPPQSSLQLQLPRCQPPCRSAFHSSAPLAARRKPRFKSVHAKNMGLVSDADVAKYSADHFPEYTAEEKAVLRDVYTPAQMAALEAGEVTIDRRDLALQGRLRADPGRLPYIDDFRTVKPVFDFRPKTAPLPGRSVDFMTPAEFEDDTIAWALGDEALDFEGLSEAELMKKLEGLAVTAQLDEARGSKKPLDAVRGEGLTEAQQTALLKERLAGEDEAKAALDIETEKWWHERESLRGTGGTGNTAIAPQLPDDIPGVTYLYKKQAGQDDDKGQDEEGTYTELKRRTGLTLQQILQIPTKIVVRRMVSNQTRLGKIRSAAIMAIAGDRNGRIGLGYSKSTEPQAASMMARLDAIKNMLPIVRYENRTIYGNARVKVSGTVVELYSRPPGYGLRVPSRLFEICRMAGISDLTARIPRSRSPMNTVKATIQALHNQVDPEEIAIGRGKKLVDARKVYYGGAVY